MTIKWSNYEIKCVTTPPSPPTLDILGVPALDAEKNKLSRSARIYLKSLASRSGTALDFLHGVAPSRLPSETM